MDIWFEVLGRSPVRPPPLRTLSGMSNAFHKTGKAPLLFRSLGKPLGRLYSFKNA